MKILGFLIDNSVYFYVAFMLAGALVGYFGRVPNFIKRHNGRVQTLCLILLLLAIGIEIGSNKEVLKALGDLGYKAAAVSFLSVLGTIFCINIFVRFLTKRE